MTTTTLNRWALSMLAALATSASLAANTETQKPTLAMVGDNWCPYNCAPDAPRRGYMIDVLERILGPRYTLSYHLAPWTRAIMMVESDQAQLLIATPASTKQKIIASIPFGIDRTCFFVRKGNPWRYNRLADLKAVRLGVVQDYSYDDNGPLDTLIAGYHKNNDARLEVAVGENALESNFRKLELGRMDVVMENENVGRYTMQELHLQDAVEFAGCASHHIATTHVAVTATRADARQIISTINTGLVGLRRSGELAQILKPYGLSDWQPAKPGRPAH